MTVPALSVSVVRGFDERDFVDAVGTCFIEIHMGTGAHWSVVGADFTSTTAGP